MEDQIPVSSPLITQEDIDYVAKCLGEGWVSGEGPYVTEFETKFAKICNREFAVSVSNGTDALDLAIAAIGLGRGDEVILPSFTIVSCLSQVLRMGATPVFVDSDSESWNMDTDSTVNSITSRTKLIIVPHIYGLPVDIDPILEAAARWGIPVIEDAAEAHGLFYKNRSCGSFGTASTFSFFANKNITTGEGGMVLTDDEVLQAQMLLRKNLAHKPGQRFVHEQLGWNMRLPAYQCALGTSQLDRLDYILARRREIGSFYHSAFAEVDFIQLPLRETFYASNSYWVFGMVMADDAPIKAIEVQNELAAKGIGSRPFFQPLHKQPVLGAFGLASQPTLANAEKLGRDGFYIPNGLNLSDSHLETVAESLLSIFEKC